MMKVQPPQKQSLFLGWLSQSSSVFGNVLPLFVESPYKVSEAGFKEFLSHADQSGLRCSFGFLFCTNEMTNSKTMTTKPMAPAHLPPPLKLPPPLPFLNPKCPPPPTCHLPPPSDHGRPRRLWCRWRRRGARGDHQRRGPVAGLQVAARAAPRRRRSKHPALGGPQKGGGHVVLFRIDPFCSKRIDLWALQGHLPKRSPGPKGPCRKLWFSEIEPLFVMTPQGQPFISGSPKCRFFNLVSLFIWPGRFRRSRAPTDRNVIPL